MPASKYGIIDCDVHPYPKAGALNKYLSERWRKHVAEYGQMTAGIYAARGTYPRFSPNTSRRDAVAAEWRRARLGCRFHPGATARSLQHHLRRAGAASGRQHLAQSGRGGGAVFGDERLAGAGVRRSRASVARVDPGAGGRSSGRRAGNRKARRRLAVLPDPAWFQDRRSRLAAAATGRSSRPRWNTGFRSACTSAARRPARHRPAAGRSSTSKIIRC